MRRCLLVLPLLLAGALIWPGVSEASFSCNYVSGAVTISMTDDDDAVKLRRAGDAISVVGIKNFGFRSRSAAVPCAGGTPTVTNTDSITVTEAAAVDFGSAIVDLGGGPLAPGATAEADGTSEIEVSLDMFGPFSLGEIRGSGGPDAIELGTVASGGQAANVNGSLEPIPDADVALNMVELVSATGRDGRDVIRASEGRGFVGPLERGDFFGSGGGGSDLLVGGEVFNGFTGGPGADRMVGLKLPDFFELGEGKDRVDAGGGPDIVFALRDGRDRLDCAGGKDFAFADRRDPHHSCEHVRHRLPKTEAEAEEVFGEIISLSQPRSLLLRRMLRGK
jgi:hypothetical protein